MFADGYGTGSARCQEADRVGRSRGAIGNRLKADPGSVLATGHIASPGVQSSSAWGSGYTGGSD